jgi:hypothetical protein
MQISVAVLNAVSKFASKETGRPYLNQVVVREGELMACDGHHLVRVPVAPMVGFSVGMMRTALLEVLTIAESLGVEHVVLAVGSRGLTYEIGSRVAYNSAVLGPVREFPDKSDLDRMVPRVTGKNAPVFRFNPCFMADMLGVEAAIPRRPPLSDYGVNLIGWGGSEDALVFRGWGKTVEEAARYIVMPMSQRHP